MDTPSLALDGAWEFVPDRGRQYGADRLPSGLPITVPGAWEAQLAEPYGVVHGWYRCVLAVPDAWTSGSLILRFGAVIDHASVWLDGRLVGESELPWLPFEIDAGPPRPGARHELVVEVDNPVNVLTDYPAFGPAALAEATRRLGGRSFQSLPHGKQTWYSSMSGLIGSVTAELAPDQRLVDVVVTPDLETGAVGVRWGLAGRSAERRATVDLVVTSPAGRVVSRTSTDAAATAATVHIPDAEPWDIGHPALYRLDSRLEPEGARVDRDDVAGPTSQASVRFGMRSIEVRDGCILLNGRPVYLRGALDQDVWPVGRSNPPSRGALETQARRVREMGLNLLRCHLKIPDPTYLDVADEVGLLVWCELPNWSTFDLSAATTGRRMLGRMVQTLGSHPSVIAWTIINEDWGTDLRHSARDRRWLRTTAEWLKEIDPGRLVIDNSACETSAAPNFHLLTDLADFHTYRSMPDGRGRWRSFVEDLAQRPSWLWSPHGDARPTGEEAIVLSEFGGWGLPRPTAASDADGREPWWWATGHDSRRPAGIEQRFRDQGLARIWRDVDALAQATQDRQFDGLANQIREIRRHPTIRGYVITELADTGWEANGLLEMDRRPKVFHDRLAEPNGPDVLICDLSRADLWGGEQVACPVVLSCFPDGAEPKTAAGGGSVEWAIRAGDQAWTGSRVAFGGWPRADAAEIACIEIDVPDVDATTVAELVVTAIPDDGSASVTHRQSIVIVPAALRRTAHPRRIGVVDPLDLWSIGARIATLGHELVPVEAADLVVCATLDRTLLASADRGRTVILLARSADAVPAGLGVARSLAIRPRRPGAGTDAERPWDGDWTSVFAWALPGVVPGLAAGGLLGDAHAEIFPDHVVDGLDVAAPWDGVEIGLFAGWVHSPVALLSGFDQGAGSIVATTLHLAPEDGPIATALLESILSRA